VDDETWRIAGRKCFFQRLVEPLLRWVAIRARIQKRTKPEQGTSDSRPSPERGSQQQGSNGASSGPDENDRHGFAAVMQ
jgi:hypothetical protein